LDLYQFDLLRDHAQISSVDLVVLERWTNHDTLGQIISNKTLVVGHTKCAIERVIQDYEHWRYDDFAGLFKDYDSRQQYQDCACRPNYVIAFVFFLPSELSHDPFADAGAQSETEAAFALFDESQDSVLVSDMKHGIRRFRFSVGHSPESRTCRFIAAVLRAAGLEYKCRGR